MGKTDHARVKGLLTEAIRMLCKSSLPYKSELNIEGLLGITLDNNDVFLVNINESVVLDGRPINKVQPPKPAKRALPNLSAQNVQPAIPNATSISSLPGTRHDDFPPNEKRTRMGDEELNGQSNENEFAVESGLHNVTKEKIPTVTSLDFGDMLARFEPEEEQRINPDPQFTSDMEEQPLEDKLEQKPNINYDYGYDNKQSSQLVAAEEDDDIVVVKEELASRASQYSNTGGEQTDYTDPMSSNLLTHDEYMTSYDSAGAYNTDLKQAPPVLTSSRRGRSPSRGVMRGRGRTGGGGSSGSFSPYNVKPSNALAGSSQGQPQTLAAVMGIMSQYTLPHTLPPSLAPSHALTTAFPPPKKGYDSIPSTSSAVPNMGPTGSFKCQLCLGVFETNEECVEHERTFHNITAAPGRGYMCKYCNKVLSNPGNLKGHITLKHTKVSNLSCPYCKRPFLHKARLGRHVAICEHKPPV